MGAKPRMEPRKEYLENARTSFLFSTPAEYRECFGEMSEKYLTPATKGTRLGKKSFRVVVHLPNKHHNDRDNYLAKMKGNWIDRTFLDSNAPIPASRIRWDSPSNPGVHLIMHTERGKRVEYFLTPSKTYAKGTMVNGQITFPTMMRNKHTYKNGKSVWRRSEKLMSCRVELGFFGVSASAKGKYSLKLGKPIVRCPPGLTKKGHAPAQFTKEWEPTDDKAGAVKVANAEENMAEDSVQYFYEAQGIDYSQLLKLGSENMENAQQTERNYYDPSMAMVGDETLDGYTPSDSVTVDLTSNQPTANYGAESLHRMHSHCASCNCKLNSKTHKMDTSASEGGVGGGHGALCDSCFVFSNRYYLDAESDSATYAPSNEPNMVSSSSFDEPTNSTFNADGSCGCGGCSCMAAEGEPVAVAEGDSLNGYAPIDSIEEGAPIGHGVTQYFGSAEGEEEALMEESTTDIGIEEGTSLEGFSGVDSVVVEAPLGHGVSQWYAESDDPLPPAPADITGQDGPEADPTNSNFSAEGFRAYHAEGRTGFVFPKRKSWPIGNKKHAIKALNYMKGGFGKKKDYAKVRAAIKKKYGSLNLASEHHKGQGYNDEQDESIGMRHRGRHQQSFTDRRDEASAMDRKGGRKYDDVMAMDAETNRWHNKKNGQFTGKWSKHRNNGEFKTHNADTAGYLQNGSLSMDGYTPLESVDVDRTSYQPTQNYGAELEDPFKTGAYFGAGAWLGVGLLSVATMAALVLGAKIMEK